MQNLKQSVIENITLILSEQHSESEGNESDESEIGRKKVQDQLDLTSSDEEEIGDFLSNFSISTFFKFQKMQRSVWGCPGLVKLIDFWIFKSICLLSKTHFCAFDVQQLKGQCKAFIMCGRQVSRWQLDLKTERSLRCLLAKATWWVKCNYNNNWCVCGFQYFCQNIIERVGEIIAQFSEKCC